MEKYFNKFLEQAKALEKALDLVILELENFKQLANDGNENREINMDDVAKEIEKYTIFDRIDRKASMLDSML